MDHRLPKVGAIVSVLLAVAAAITFVFLNQRFEGPDPVGGLSSPYELTARFDNTKTLPSKQPVLHKGVSVGTVRSVDYDDATQQGVVTFTLTEEISPIYSDAKLQIGERSLLGDAYLNLMDPGTEAAGELEAGDELAGPQNIVKPVNFDEALDFLDEEGRERTRSLIDTIAEGASRDGNGARLNGTVGGVARTVSELRALTDALVGQEEQLASLVSDSATVLSELGSRESALRTIVGAGRSTFDALAANTASLEQGLEELPRLLDSGRSALSEIRPLLVEARPLLASLRELAPDLVPAFADGGLSLGPVTTDLVAIIELLPAQREAVEEFLPQVADLNRVLAPTITKTAPAALNAVPIADYLAPRSNSIGAFFGLGASVAAPKAVAPNGETSRYGRFGVVLPGSSADEEQPGAYGPPGTCNSTFCYNAFPLPNDALSNQPFGGTYPRLFAFEPPSRRSVLRD